MITIGQNVRPIILYIHNRPDTFALRCAFDTGCVSSLAPVQVRFALDFKISDMNCFWHAGSRVLVS